MKKYILLFIIFSLFLSACSIGNENNLFQKKQECVEHQPQIEKDIEKYNWTDETDTQSAELDEIFYSPKKDSCLYVYHTNKTGSINSKDRDVVDFFTKETLYFAHDFCTFSGKDCSAPYDKNQNGYSEKMVTKEILNQKIKELKGE